MDNLVSPQIFNYITYSMLFPNVTPSISYLETRLKDFDITQIVLILSKLSLILSDVQLAKDLSFQKSLSNNFVNSYTRERLFKKMDRFSLVFHRCQLLFLLKNSFLKCSSRAETDFQISQIRHNLETCCLLANDFLLLLKVEEEKLDALEADKTKEYLRLELLPSYELYNPPELMFKIARTRLLFKTIFPQMDDSSLFIDIEKKFQEFTDLFLED